MAFVARYHRLLIGMAVMLAMLALAGCTSIKGSLPLPDGRTAEISVFRVWPDAGITLAPDGSFSYSSNADTAAAASMNQQLLQILLAGGRLAAPGP